MVAPYSVLIVSSVLVLLGLWLIYKQSPAIVGLGVLLLGWVLMCLLFPYQIDELIEQGEDVPKFLWDVYKWVSGLLAWLYLGVVGVLALIGHALAKGTSYQVGWLGIRPAAGPGGTTAAPTPAFVPTTQPEAAKAFLVGGIIILLISGFFLLKSLGFFRPDYLSQLMNVMQLSDQEKKDPEFQVILDPIYFNVPVRLISKDSRADWITVADQFAKQEGDYTVEKIRYVRFHSPNGRTLPWADVHFEGKLDEDVFIGTVTVPRRLDRTDDELKVRRLTYQVGSSLPATKIRGVTGGVKISPKAPGVPVSIPSPPSVTGKKI